MMRHFIKPALVKYGGARAGCAADSSYMNHSLLRRLDENKTFFRNLSMKACARLLKRKKSIGTVNSVISILSGCCFSKSSSDENNLTVETDRLIIPEKLSVDNQKGIVAVGTSVPLDQNDETHEPVKLQRVDGKGNCNQKTRKELDSCLVSTHLTEAVLPVSSNNAVANFKKKKRQKFDETIKEKTHESDDDVCLDEADAHLEGKKTKKKKQKVPKIQPNYFIAFQISNPEIHKCLTEVQDYIVEQDKRLAKSMVSVSKSHITLMVMYLGNEEEHAKALDTLKVAHEELNVSISKCPLTLQFQGLGHFRNQVVFAKICEDDGLSRLHDYAESIENHFKNASILSTDDKRSFNPHLTLMKLSKDPKLYRKGIKKINPAFYEPYKNQMFGNQIIKGIQLLRMSGPVNEKGYYTGSELLFDDC